MNILKNQEKSPAALIEAFESTFDQVKSQRSLKLHHLSNCFNPEFGKEIKMFTLGEGKGKVSPSALTQNYKV